MARLSALLSLALLAGCSSASPEPVQERGDGPNVVLITIDGLRWQEVFSGADPYLVEHEEYSHNPELVREQFWHEDPQQRRQLLMPFLWEKFGNGGQLLGNRAFGCEAVVANNMWFSYPGYNELLVGYPDDARIDSNDPVDNPNVTVMEAIHQLPEFRGWVAGAAMWDPIGNVVNENRSGIVMRTSVESLGRYPGTAVPAFFSDLGHSASNIAEHGGLAAGSVFSGAPWSHMRDRYLDLVTFDNTLEMVDELRPRVLYMALGAPDENGHRANYEGYLLSIRESDDYIRRLWEKLESMPEYAGKTSYIVTVDHGRGLKEQWTDHSTGTPHSNQVWFALLGPEVASRGEVRETCALQLAQVASTLAAVLGVEYRNSQPVAGPLPFHRAPPGD